MAFYYPELNINLPEGTELDIAIVASAFDDAFATNVVKTMSKNGKLIKLIIDPGNHGHNHLWLNFFEDLTRYKSLWIPLKPTEYNGRFQYSTTPQEEHVEVRYANPLIKMVWNRFTQIYEWDELE